MCVPWLLQRTHRQRSLGSRAYAHSRRRSFPGAPAPSPGVGGCVLGPSGRVYGRYWKFAHIMGQHTFPKVAGACSKSPSPPRPRPSAPSRGFEVKRAWCVASYAGTAVTAVRVCTSPPLRFARGSSIRGCTYRMCVYCVRVLFFFFWWDAVLNSRRTSTTNHFCATQQQQPQQQ